MDILKQIRSQRGRSDDAKVEVLTLKDIKFDDGDRTLDLSELQSSEEKDHAAPSYGETPSRANKRSSAQLREINALKQDLGKMSGALKESMRLNQDSMSEIDRISSFLRTAEINTMSLERLQPENENLKNRLENVQSELSKKNLWASELESKSIAYKARFEETHAELETARVRLAELEDGLREEQTKRSDFEFSLEKMQTERRELFIMIDDLKTESNLLQNKVQALRETELMLSRQNTELEKQAEVLTAQVEDQRREKEKAVSTLKSLRLDYSELKAEQVETVSRLDKARHDIESSQQTLADYRMRTDDKIFALNSVIEGLKAQQKINEDMSNYDDLERSKLKAEAERERRRAEDFNQQLLQKSRETEENRVALAKSKLNYERLNEKFLNLMSEMESIRSENRMKTEKLEQYSSISGIAVGQSFYDGSTDRRKDSSAAKSDDGTRFDPADAMPNLKLVGEKPPKS